MTTGTVPALDTLRLQDAAATSPAINTEILFTRCMCNASFALTLLRELECNGKEQVDTIVRHAADDDAYAVAEAAHSLMGAAALFGAEPLCSVAGKIEAAGRACETSILMDMAHDLSHEMDRCLAYVSTVRAELDRRSSCAW